jgi:hypothetical protein
MFPAVTVDAIEAYALKYRNSDAERADVLKGSVHALGGGGLVSLRTDTVCGCAAYVDEEGDMSALLNTVVLCTFDDEARFRAIIQAAIDEGSVPEYDLFAVPAEEHEQEVDDLSHSDCSDDELDGSEPEEAAAAAAPMPARRGVKAAAKTAKPAKRVSRADEAAEAALLAKKLGVPMGEGSDASLFAMIRSKQQADSASLISRLEAKYAGPAGGKKRRK